MTTDSNPHQPRLPAPALLAVPHWMYGVGLVLGLAGCAAVPPRSAETITPVDNVASERLREHVRAENQRLLEHQAQVRADLNRKAPPPKIEPVAPRLDPLEGKLINVAMSKASISTVLQAFADAGKLNLIVDPTVLKGGQLADMFLRNVTLREGLDEIMRTYDVVGEIHGNTLRVNLTEEKFFKLSFLNARASLQMGSGGNVFGGSGANSNNNAQQGSLTLAGGGGFSTDPYQELETALKNLLGDSLKPAAIGVGGIGAPAPSVPAPAPTLTPTAATGAAATGSPAGLYSNTSATASSSVSQSGSLAGRTLGEEGGFALNKMTGTLYVKARPSKMRAVEKLLDQIQAMLARQVYVEAQLIDVQLNDNFEFGVDWQHLRSRLAAGFRTSPMQLSGSSTTLPNSNAGALLGRALTIPAQLIGSTSGASAGLAYLGSNYGIIINALRSYGNLKILSNPNIQVRNGTPALLSVGSSTRYISQSSTTQTAPGGGAVTTSANVQTDSVFSGVMVGVLPLVREDGRVELLINPMQSDVDPATLQLVQAGGGNLISLPQVSYKGLTTTLNVGDGDVVVVGGLIDQRHSGIDRGAPGVSDVPLLGKLFGNEHKTHSSRELVIVMRVHVL